VVRRIIEGGTINEPEDKPDPRFALLSTVNWMRALCLLIADNGVNFASAKSFYASQGKRSMDALVENTVLEQLWTPNTWIKSSQFSRISMTSFMAQTLGENISSKLIMRKHTQPTTP